MEAASLLILASSLFLSWGLRTGAPPESCADGMPRHGVPARPTLIFPYNISVAAVPGGDYSISLKAKRRGDYFKGFLIQARSKEDGQIVPGTFTQFQADVSHALTCVTPADTVTHSSNLVKTTFKARWTPPSDFSGSILFHATVVRNKEEFWMGILSKEVTITSLSTNLSDNPLDTLYAHCNTQKGCEGLPINCIHYRDCKILLTFVMDRGAIAFEIIDFSPTRDSYVAVGLSEDRLMGNDSVTECIFHDGPFIVQQSWNYVNKTNQVLSNPQLGLAELSTTFQDGILRCRWRRDVFTIMGENIYYNLMHNQYYLLLAKGKVSDKKKMRHQFRIASLNSVKLSEYKRDATTEEEASASSTYSREEEGSAFSTFDGTAEVTINSHGDNEATLSKRESRLSLLFTLLSIWLQCMHMYIE